MQKQFALDRIRSKFIEHYLLHIYINSFTLIQEIVSIAYGTRMLNTFLVYC